jgi:hypothetical protein
VADVAVALTPEVHEEVQEEAKGRQEVKWCVVTPVQE